jgi:hypothetical protein
MRVRTLVAGTVALAALGAGGRAASPAAAQVPENRLLAFDDGQVARVGSLRAGGDLRLRNAVRAYGRPSEKRPRGGTQSCTRRWKRAGISVLGTTFDSPPRRRCDTRRLHIQRIVVNGAGWTTDAGLAVGEPLARLRELYPDAERSGKRGYALEIFDFGFGTEPTPTLVATVSRDVVVRFEIWVGAAGD